MGEKEVNAERYFRPVKGQTQSHLLFAGGALYVVKFAQNPISIRTLANEWLATKLAMYLGLPSAECALVHVSEDFVANEPALTATVNNRTIRYESGVHFGSRFAGGLMPGNVLDYLPTASLMQLENPQIFCAALVFDKWTCNADSRQCVFTKRKRANAYSARLIDHGLCFGETWTFSDPPLRGCYGNKIVYKSVTGRTAFEPWLTRIEAISEDILWRAAASIPKQWYECDDRALERLIATLMSRRPRVWGLLLETRRARPDCFPLWT